MQRQIGVPSQACPWPSKQKAEATLPDSMISCWLSSSILDGLEAHQDPLWISLVIIAQITAYTTKQQRSQIMQALYLPSKCNWQLCFESNMLNGPCACEPWVPHHSLPIVGSVVETDKQATVLLLSIRHACHLAEGEK